MENAPTADQKLLLLHKYRTTQTADETDLPLSHCLKGGALLFHYSEPAFLNNYINSSNIKELQKSKTTHVHCKITLKPSYDIHFNK